MTTDAYWDWVNAGRHYMVAAPIEDMVAYAKGEGIGWLGTLGSDDERHLKADNPQDHTPFSTTPWPLPLPGYVVTACDLSNGAWCGRFLAECREGLHPWVKYVNFGGHHYDSRRKWVAEPSNDEHFHVSTRTDFLYLHISNPFRKEADNMTDSVVVTNTHDRVQALVTGKSYGVAPEPAYVKQVQGVKDAVDKIATMVSGVGGLTTDDRAAIQALTDAVNALNSRLTSP